MAASCSSLPYKDDDAFLVSAQANSPEFIVYVNGRPCVDADGQSGLCAKRIKSDQDLVVRIDPQDYDYALQVKCSQQLPPIPDVNVLKGKAYEFRITAAAASTVLAYTCRGEVFPADRKPPVSGVFKFHVNILDAKYTAREAITLSAKDGKQYLVLGQYARHAWVYDRGRWAFHSKKPVVEVKGNPAQVRAYSESFAMRFNALNMVW